jgi:hypothetical protein
VRRLLVLIVIGCVFAVVRPALAQSSQELARQKFAEAVASHQQGDYAGAAGLFEEAYRLAPAAGAKFNAAVSWDAANELPRAADAYETALAMGGLVVEQAEQARERLSALERVLGYLRIDEPMGALISVAHVERAPVPLRVHLRPGTHTITLEAGGTTRTHEVNVGAGEAQRAAFDAPAPRVRETPRAAPVAATAPLPPPRERVERDTGSAQRTWGWVAIGAGVVFAGAAVVLGLQTLDAREEWEQTDKGPEHHDKRERAVTFRALTNVAWGGAALAGGAGLALLLTAPSVEF